MIPGQHRRDELLAGVPTAPPLGRGADREDHEPDMAAHHDLIGDRYELVARIGRGSFGEVWKAWDTHLERDVAVKLLVVDPDAGPATVNEDRQRFWREARETASFDGDHHIVLVTDFNEHRGQLYLVMRYLRGVNLRELLVREVRLDPVQAVSIVRQVGIALGAAHDAGLVHRDVKPANVFVGTNDRVTLLDFGMLGALDAGRLSQITRRGQFGGTLEYMAPERFPGNHGSPPEAPSEPSGDIYSLACLLYQCLTGSLPFSGNIFELQDKHQRGARPVPGEHDPDLEEFNDVVARGLAVDRSARPQRAADFVSDAERALAARQNRLDRAVEEDRRCRVERQAHRMSHSTPEQGPAAAPTQPAVASEPAATAVELDGQGLEGDDPPPPTWRSPFVVGACTGIAGTAAVLFTDPSPLAGGVVIALCWASGVCAGVWARPK